MSPKELPNDINLFEVAGDKYPLMKSMADEGYILKATLKPGDCLYIPAFYYS